MIRLFIFSAPLLVRGKQIHVIIQNITKIDKPLLVTFEASKSAHFTRIVIIIQ